MANRQYIGARYVPKFYENPNGGCEWEPGTSYEALTIVTFLNNSYTSRVPVPANAPAPNVNGNGYWVATGNYNAQVQEYIDKVNDIENNVSNIENSISPLENNITNLFFDYPEYYGAKGDGVTDDSDALSQAINNQSNKPILLTKKYFINKIITVNNSLAKVIYGSCGNSDSTIVDDGAVRSSNIIFGENGGIVITGVSNITFTNVGFTGDGFVDIQSFRNVFLNCSFHNMNNAIQVNQGTNWNGENKILNCIFHNVKLCVNLVKGSDGVISGCIVDGTVEKFITGTGDAGYMVENNHDYSVNGSTFSGYNLNFVGNYVDGSGKLEFTGTGGFNVVGNMFLFDPESSKKYLINLTANQVNNANIIGNTVQGNNNIDKIDDFAFINIKNSGFFNNIEVNGNNLATIGNVFNRENGANVYYTAVNGVLNGAQIYSGQTVRNVGVQYDGFAVFNVQVNGNFIRKELANFRNKGMGVYTLVKNDDTTISGVFTDAVLSYDDFASIKSFTASFISVLEPSKNVVNLFK